MKKILYIISFLLAGLNVHQSLAQKPSVYKIDKLPFNYESFSEISPVIFKDGILFCSNRRFSTFSDRTGWDGQRLYNIYIVEKKDSTRWGKPKELKSERNTHFNNGPFTISADGKTVYFTSEVVTGKASQSRNFKNRSGIFIAELSGTGLTSLKPFKYNSTQYDVGNPSISNDGKYLFFSSNKPGGKGLSDIYYSEFINGEWAEPVNMGANVNTASIENFPYIHSSGKLYFTSDRKGGFGKLDVYSTMLYNGKWEDPSLLPEPINSPSDDFAFVASDNLQSGYFSSNRSFNDDIFRFSSTIIRKTDCKELVDNSYCYQFLEENAVKYDTVPFLYKWKFGDGSTGVGAVVEHCYSGPGKYIVQLDVVNLVTKETIYNEKTDTLILENVEQPYITGPDKFSPGKNIKLNAKETNLPGWNIDRYYWNFGDETIAVGEQVDKIYSKQGIYNIQLIVTTAAGPGGITREACVSKNINIIPGL